MEVIVGFVIAFIIGVTGVGGGTITAPVLILFFGVSPAAAVGTALVFSSAVKIPACIVYLQKKQVDASVLRYLLYGGVPGIVGGSLLLGELHQAGFKNVVLIAVGLTIMATAIFSLGRARAQHNRRSIETSAPPRDRRKLLPWIAGGIGIEVGFSSAGAGALGTVALLSLTTLTAAQVVGTDLVFGCLLSAIGGLVHIGLGEWIPSFFWKMALGGIPGALLGARFATVVHTRTLRFALLVWLVYIGTHLTWRGLAAVAL